MPLGWHTEIGASNTSELRYRRSAKDPVPNGIGLPDPDQRELSVLQGLYALHLRVSRAVATASAG